MKIKTDVLQKDDQNTEITELQLRVLSLDMNYRRLFLSDMIRKEVDEASKASIIFRDTAEIDLLINILNDFKKRALNARIGIWHETN